MIPLRHGLVSVSFWEILLISVEVTWVPEQDGIGRTIGLLGQICFGVKLVNSYILS